MRRHLVFLRDFDTRAQLLEMPKSTWGTKVKELHLENRERLMERLKIELGVENFEAKVENFKDAGSSPFSIISYHNAIYHQVRYAFIHGFYYPALAGACALGERMLNHLILDLREDFKTTNEYKDVYRKDSFADWGKCIDTLQAWGVFQHPDVALEFNKLKILRMRSIHYNAETYLNLRKDALAALAHLREIISLQFGFGGKWLLAGTAGHFFIKKEAETHPFIRKYYLPQSPLVTPYFAMDTLKSHWIFFDRKNFDEREITDAEFAQLFNERAAADIVKVDVPWADDVIVRIVLDTGVHELGCKKPEE